MRNAINSIATLLVETLRNMLVERQQKRAVQEALKINNAYDEGFQIGIQQGVSIGVQIGFQLSQQLGGDLPNTPRWNPFRDADDN